MPGLIETGFTVKENNLFLQANNEETATEIRSMGESATAFVVDVTKTDDIHKTAEQMRREVGDVEILVNNAGILYGGELLKLKEAHIRRTFEVNTLAHFWVNKSFLKWCYYILYLKLMCTFIA